MNVLVTGGAGYIGSHAVKRLEAHGHSPSSWTTSSAGTARPSPRTCPSRNSTSP